MNSSSVTTTRDLAWKAAEAMRSELTRVARNRYGLRREEAQDVVQETILRIGLKLDDLGAVKAFAHLAMRRIIIERWRSRSCQETPMEISQDALKVLASGDQEIAAIELWDLAKDLPEHYVVAVWANYIGHDQVSGAQSLGISQSAYKTRLHRGRMKARELAGFGVCETFLGVSAPNQHSEGIADGRGTSTGLSDINTEGEAA